MKIAVGLFLVLAPFSSAFAQSAINDIAKTQTEIENIGQQISNAQMQSSRASARLTALSNNFNPLKARHDALQRQYANDAATYNGNCAGRPVSYGNCPSWRARVLAEQQQLGMAVADMERRAQELTRQGQQVSNELVLSNARVKKLVNYKSQLEARLRNLKANLVQAPPAAPPAQTANTRKCEGEFCTNANPKTSGEAAVATGQKQTTYSSASAQADAAAKAKEAAGCVFDGQAGCKSGTSLSFPQSGGRGSASLSPAIKEAMSKTSDGKKLLNDEMMLRTKYADADNKIADIKAKRDAATDDATRGKLAVEYATAGQLKTDIGQQLYATEIKVETEATKYKLDK